MPNFLCWCLLLGSFGIVLSGNLTEEQIGEENRKWLDDNTELVKKYLDAVEENHPEVCWRSHPNLTEKYFEKSTDEQIREVIGKWLDDRPEYIKKYLENSTDEQIGEVIGKWLDDHPEYIKKYLENSTDEQIGEVIGKWLDDHPEYIKKYLGKVTPEQILQMLCNHREVLEEPNGSWNSLTTVLLLATCILALLSIVLLYIVLTNKNNIRMRCISWKQWIHERPSSQNRRGENCPQTKETVITMEELEKLTDDQIREQMQKCLGVYPVMIEKFFEKLTDDQIRDQMQKCLGVYPVLMEKYFGKLTEDQICEQIQKWQDVYPGLFMKKYLESLKEDQVRKWLNDHPDFMDQYLDERENDHQDVMPTLDELSVRLTESGTGIESNQMQLVSTQKTFNAAQRSDEQEKYDPPTLDDLAVTLHKPESGTEDNQRQLESLQEVITSSTCSSPSSDTFSEPGHSGIQPFNKDEQDANPEGDMAQTEREDMPVKEESDTEGECEEPLLKVHGDQKPKPKKL